MKIAIRVAFVLLLLSGFQTAWAQCDDSPDLDPWPTVSSRGTTTATLSGEVDSDGGGDGCQITATGVEWATVQGGPYTVVTGTENDEGPFDVDVTGLPSGSVIYFKTFADNADHPRGYSNEVSFYTYSTEPGAHAATLTATALSHNSISLQFPPANSISDAAGYVILFEDGSDPNLNNLYDGQAPTGASDYYDIITDASATSYTASTGLSGNQEYRFTIIPYNRQGHDNTYNYLTIAGFPIASATTQASLSISPLTGGLAAATLNSNTNNHALAGFRLDANGPMTFQAVTIHLSSTTTEKFTNFRLCASSNNTFDGVGTDAPIAGASFAITGSDITITFSESLTASHRYFLVADVEPGATNSMPSVTFSYTESDFTFSPSNLSGTVTQSRNYSFNDVTPPILVSTVPADNSTGVDFNINQLVLTFNENVNNLTGASSNSSHRVIIYNAATGLPVLTVNRSNVDGDGTPVVEVPVAAGTLDPNTAYYVQVGGSVIEDTSPDNNNWPGISNQTSWNFTTSGVAVNNVTSTVCTGSFQSISDIVISEVAAGDFITSGTVYLEFSDPNFVFDISSVTVTAGPAGNTDITSISLNPKTLTRLTLNYTLDGNNNRVDEITISGLQVYASAAGSTNIIAGNSVSAIWAIDEPVTFATINVGSGTPAAPTLQTAQDLLYCLNEDISSATVAVDDDGGTFTWYSNASLSTPLASGHEVDVQADLGINTSTVGTVTRYVVRIDGCQSSALPVIFEIAPVPVADAGPATASVCAGASITLGGSPTLITPSVSGAYQYLWSAESPVGFTVMGTNPTVSPAGSVSGSDTTYHYTVMIVDANGCASDILSADATIAVLVQSTDEVITYNSPLSTSFTLNSDPIELSATPSINSYYSGNGVYLSNGKYYFDPDLAETDGSPHTITYTTELSNGCVKTETRQFSVSSSSGTIDNVAGSYCVNETADPLKVLSLGEDWENDLAANNVLYASTYGYTYELYDFQTYIGTNVPGSGVKGSIGNQYIDPQELEPYPLGTGTYAYVGMRVRQRTPGILGLPDVYGPPIFWQVKYVNLYAIPDMKVGGIRVDQVLCDVNEAIELEANFNSGTYEISRDNTNWTSGSGVGLVESPPNSGKALFNPHSAYVSTSFAAPNNNAATGVADFYLRYTYVVPGTSGSNSAACEGVLIIPFKISNNPTVSLAALAKTQFCYEDANIPVNTIAPNPADPMQTDVITGFGVFDNKDRTAFFDPSEGLAQKAFANNVPLYTNYNAPEDIVISATRTDANGCHSTVSQTVQVRPAFPASFSESDLNVCYEDGAQDIIGDQPNGFFVLAHPNMTQNFAQTTINDFDLRTYFDQAVTNGADGSVMQSFHLTFNTSDPVLGCQNAVTKTFTVNPPIPMDIGGMTDGMIVCGNGQTFELTGNQPSAGTFEISTSETTGFVSNALGLSNTGSGKATYSPPGAGVPAGDPQKSLYIRYSFLGAGCVGSASTTEELIINPQPAIAFSGSTPAPYSTYCHEQGATPTTVTLSTNPSTNVSFSGFGVTDNTNGTAVFNPTLAYQQSSLANNMNPLIDQTVRDITVTAVRTDALSCSNNTPIVYTVNPLPTANFNTPVSEFCYENETPILLEGSQPIVKWEFIYRNTTPPNYSPAPLFQSSVLFDPRVFFDDAVDHGANALATIQFDVIYTAINNSTGCTNQLTPVPLTVSPKIPVAISGVESQEVFCSNSPNRLLEFSPPGGTFRINGANEPFSNNQYIFNPPIDGPEGGTDYAFRYTVITGSNCTNTEVKTVRVLPSPRALFDVQPQCDTALIAYDAQTSTNLPSAIYSWSFSGEPMAGQNVEYRFPGVSTYYAKLKVEHPPYFDISSGKTFVCVDSLQRDQVVGPYPKDLRFEYFNTCEGDDTNFEVTSPVPINRVSWDFDDGEVTPLGILSNSVTGLPQTTGTYQQPVHRFTGAHDALNITVEGRTSEAFGDCPATYTKTIAILKRWIPTGGENRYNMAALDDGKGFWVAEDQGGHSTWEFNTAAKTVIQSNQKTWVTGAAVPYNGQDISYVNSPCFDLSDFSRPVISLRHWTNTESSDGAVLQYSTDGGASWGRLGGVATGLNWYNRLSISSNPGEQTAESSGWSSLEQFNWAIGKHALDVPPAEREKIRFRIAFASSFANPENRDGYAFNNVIIEERNRTILAENFTTLNAPEAANNVAFRAFKADEGTGQFDTEEIVKLQYHHSPAQNPLPPDNLHLANPTDQNARAAFYGVTSPSRAFIDGGFGQSSALSNYQLPAIDLFFSLRSLVTSPVTIALDFEPEPADRLNIRASIQATEALDTVGQFNIFIAVAEQSVEGQVFVLRKLLPDASGTLLTSLSAADPAQEVQVSYDMRHVTRLPDGSFAPFAVIAFVQNVVTKEVLQTVVRLDGSASPQVVTGLETRYENYVRIYPNPADEIMNIVLPAPAEHAMPVKIFDMFGREVYNSAFEAGQYSRTVATKDLSAGVYLIQLSTPEGVVQKKAIIAHD